MDHPTYNPPQLPRYPVGRQEILFGVTTVILCICLWNSILFGGFNLGYAFFSLTLLGCTARYIRQKGGRFGTYETALLVFAAVLTAGFARSADAGVKAVMLLLSLFAANLSFCLASGQNRRGSGSFGTLFDAPRAFFTFGFGGMGAALRGLEDARKNAGSAGKKSSAALLGVVLAVPVVAVMIPLLMRSDAAFEGLVGLLPETDWTEPFYSLLTGLLAAWVLFARGLGLRFRAKDAPAPGITKRLSAITVNILLGTVCAMYLAYLFSQLAYFSGGFLGILPEDYTLAEYARRGFFEMAWLSGINLGLVLLSAGLVEREEKVPAGTRWMCLFIGAVTLFLIAAASAKMLLYIDSYGLTRLRVLTQTVMIWLGLTTVLVCVRLLKPRFAWMKAVILTALALGAALMWLDVDAFVARYNVRAYQSGKLETVDLRHLSGLGYGAVPYIAELTEDTDPEIAKEASAVLYHLDASVDTLREWNWSRARAAELLAGDSDLGNLRAIGKQLDLDLSGAALTEYRDTHGGFHGDGETVAVITLPRDAALEAEDRMRYGQPYWQALPLRQDLQQALYGSETNGALFTDNAGNPLLPEVKTGWYFFYDEQGHPYTEESIYGRPSFNFTLAVYDPAHYTLYYFKLDT